MLPKSNQSHNPILNLMLSLQLRFLEPLDVVDSQRLLAPDVFLHDELSQSGPQDLTSDQEIIIGVVLNIRMCLLEQGGYQFIEFSVGYGGRYADLVGWHTLRLIEVGLEGAKYLPEFLVHN
jgi:hypothetical protein